MDIKFHQGRVNGYEVMGVFETALTMTHFFNITAQFEDFGQRKSTFIIKRKLLSGFETTWI